VAAEDLVAGTGDAGLVGHVDRSGCQPFGDLVEQVGSPTSGDDGAARRGEAPGKLKADSRGGPGDEDGAVGDVHVLLLFTTPPAANWRAQSITAWV